MVTTKPGVVMAFSPAIMHMLKKLVEWSDRNKLDLVITSGIDGKHSANSKHYTSQALDVRSKNFPNEETKYRFVREMARMLGPQFFIFLEVPGKDNEHFHMQVARGGTFP